MASPTRMMRPFVRCVLAASLALASSAACRAVDIHDPLTDPKLKEEWVKDQSDKSKGSIASGPGGLAIKCEWRHYALIKRRNELSGSDSRPLNIGVTVETEAGCGVWPGLHLHWDNDNYATLGYLGDNHIYMRWMVNGVYRERPFYNLIPDPKKAVVSLRFALLSRNILAYYSLNGTKWNILASLDARPGKEGAGPSKIILGRGWTGEKTDKNAKTDLANDYYPDGNQRIIQTTYRNFFISDTGAPLPEPLTFEKKDTWQDSINELEAAGVPHAWQLLGPRPDRDFALFRRKEGLPPDFVDDWKTVPADESGKPFRTTNWTRPEDEAGSYVDLAEILDPKSQVLAYARTEIVWPTDGPATFYFDEDGMADLYLNNQKVFGDHRRDGRAAKDGRAVPVQMKRGINAVKVKISQSRGAWGFFFRSERADPGYRIRVLERLLELYPEESQTWRGKEARLEIPRRYMEMDNYSGALGAYDKALEAVADYDEYRFEAIAGKLGILAMLRDWKALAAAGDQYLAKFPNAPGSDDAFMAAVIGRVMGGEGDAAEAKLKAELDLVGKDATRIEWAYRVLSGAYASDGKWDKSWSVLERLADSAAADPVARSRAAFEAAFMRLQVEQWQTAAGAKLDTNRLTAACQAAKKGLAVIPAGKNPQVLALMQEGEEDLKAGRHERAAADYWGAALLAMCSASSDGAYYFGFNKAYKAPDFFTDPKTKQPKDRNQAIQDLDKIRGPLMGEVNWDGNWKAIGPFENADGVGERTAYGPEKNADLNAKHAGKGGEKAWVDLDPTKGWQDLGVDLKAFLGETKEGVAYIARDLEAPADRSTTLHLAVRSGWFAWLDGKPIGEDTEERFRIDGVRIPLNLKAGKHRVLIKLVAPGDGGAHTFRCHVGDEPELAQYLLARVWLAQAYPQIAFYPYWYQGIDWLVNWCYAKVNTAAHQDLGEAYAFVNPGNPDLRYQGLFFPTQRMLEEGAYAEAGRECRRLLRLLETWPDAPSTGPQVWQATERLTRAMIFEGDSERADEALRSFVARYPFYGDARGMALIMRGALRVDLSIAEASRPFYLRAARELPPGNHWMRYVPIGVDFARQFRPERSLFTTDHDVQNTVESAWRQMKAANADDVERAMRNLGTVLRGDAGSLLRISDVISNPRYVGAREYIRAILSGLEPDARAIYQKVVAGAAEERFRAAAGEGDAAGLEAVAAAYPYTPVAARSLNKAANLYLDHDEFAQAASALQLLLREYRGLDGVSDALAAAKLAHALAREGQDADARVAAERLAKEFGTEALTIGGHATSGAEFASQVLAKLSKGSTGAEGDSSVSATYSGSQRRTGPPLNAPAPAPGPVQWVRRQYPAASVDSALARFGDTAYAQIPSYPVVSEGRAYLGALESMQCLDAASGKIIWRKTWGSSGTLLPAQFSGFPVSCPEVKNGKVYQRAVSETQTALQCRNDDDGQLIWSTEAIPELKKAVWLSDPVVAYGLAIAVFLEPSDMNTHGLAAVDAETGRFRWKTLLVTGNSGIKSYYEYFGSSLQLGPPAVDGGVVYAATGLNSMAALNAFSGEAVWISGYPKMNIPSLDWGGQSQLLENVRGRVLKFMNRGPASPVIGSDTVVLAPKDAAGLIAFDRRNGTIRWNHELEDARFLAGTCDGRLLVVDNEVKALEMKTGRQAWSYDLRGEPLYGHPGYSGGVLYLPTTDSLQLLDAHTGTLKSSMEWDPRVGPVANLVIAPQGVLGLNPRLAALLGPPNAQRMDLPLEEARGFVAEGKWEKAAECFARAAQSPDSENVLAAVSGRVQALSKLGQNEEGLKDIDRLLADKPNIIQAEGGWWQVEKSILADSLRARLGAAPPPPPPVTDGVSGTLAFAWQLPGRDPKFVFPQDGPKDRFLVQTGNSLCMMRLSAKFETLWQNYVGPGMKIVGVLGNRILMMGTQKLVMLDRDSGEQIWQRFLPTEEPTRRKAAVRRNYLRGFNQAAFGEESVAALAGDAMFVFSARTGEEIWSNWRGDRRALGIAYAGGRLVEIAGHSDRNTYLYAYDPLKGTRLQTQILERKRVESVATFFTPDFKYMVYRPQGNRLACVNLVEGRNAWEMPVPRLQYNGWNNFGLKFTDEGHVAYYGDNNDGNERGWHSFVVNPADGKLVHHLRGGMVSVGGGSFLHVREDWGRTLARRDADKGEKDVWVFQYPQRSTDNHGLISAFLSKAKDRLYLLYVRRSDSESDQFILRTFDWATGQLLQSEYLPGTPIRLQEGWGFRSPVERRGDLLLVGTWEGTFAYAPKGDSRSDAIANLKKTLADPNLAAVARRDARSALLALEPVGLQAFIAPSGLKMDGDLTEWASTEPMPLAGADSFVPLTDEAKWNGPEDSSARVCAAWDGRGLYLSVDVKDDLFVPPAPGVELGSGDSIKVAVNGLTNPYNGFDTRETVVCSMALVEGRTVMNISGGGETDEQNKPDGKAVRAPNGKGVRYELFLPWALIRRNPAYRPGDRMELRVGVAAYDRDEGPVNGAMEWGAGLTSPALAPMRLGQLSLLAISVEKIERYRGILTMVPDAPETMKYLNLILATKRGQKADQEKIAELEGFLKQRPQSSHAYEVLTMLQSLYRSTGDADPKAKAVALAKNLKCQPVVADALTAQMLKGIGLRGEYFGTRNFTDLKLERTDAALNYDWAGPPGQGVPGENFSVRWTGEIVPKFSETYTIYTISDDGVRMWINDQKITENWTDHAPTEDSGKIDLVAGKPYTVRIEFFQGGGPSCFKLLWSSKSQAKEVIPAAQMNSTPAGNALKIEKPPEDPAKQQAANRAVAKVLQDSSDGLVFLRRVMDAYKGDDRLKKCIQECEDFLRANPETPNALPIMQMLQNLYAQDGDKNPLPRCEAVMEACKLSRDNRRAFYSQFVPAWNEWWIVGPFMAVGERRGLDMVMEPEKNVDLNWKAKGPGETELTWSKMSFAKDKKGNPLDGYIRLHAPLGEKLDKDIRRDLDRSAYFAYAYTKFTCPTKRAALLLYGVNDAISIWVNGRRVVTERNPGGQKDREAMPIRLKDGENEILIKAGCPYGQLYFIFRLSDENGRPFDDLKMP